MSLPEVLIDRHKLVHNAVFLQQEAAKHGVMVHFVTKCFCAQREMVETLYNAGITQFADSRVQNLQSIRYIGCNHMLLRIPMLSEVTQVVDACDISLNSDISVIEALADAASAKDKKHGVILMVEMGDLREGFMPDEVLEAAKVVLNLKSLVLCGIGANFNCYGSIIPEVPQMQKLTAIAESIEQRYNIKLPFISGGNSGSLYMLLNGTLPPRINHLRLGESYLLGRETSFGNDINGLYTDVFKLRAEIVEISHKPSVPTGRKGLNALGKEVEFADHGIIKRAIVALGEQDTYIANLRPCLQNIKFLGASSDHAIYDITHSEKDFKVGDMLEFSVDYAALSRIFISDYICKKLI